VGVTHWDGMSQTLAERIIGRQLLKAQSVTSVNHPHDLFVRPIHFNRNYILYVLIIGYYIKCSSYLYTVYDIQ